MTRPTFRDAYLVESEEKTVGFVRRERHVWTIYRLGAPKREREVFASREEAGQRLAAMAAQDNGRRSKAAR